MIDSPAIELQVSPSDTESYHQAGDSQIGRIQRVRAAWREIRTDTNGMRVASQPLAWKVTEPVVEHAGFGSGTQFCLAVAAALEQLAHGGSLLRLENVAPLSLALLTGRGHRSAIGLHGFLQGGFLVDGGRQRGPSIGELAAAGPTPERWRFVLLRPVNGEMGLSGEHERRVFEALPPMEEKLTDRLCALTLMQILPAVRSGDSEEFRAGLAEFGCLVGEYFSPVQGGIFSSPSVRELAARFPQYGKSFVQSSWGPTVVIPVGDVAAAMQLVDELRRTLAANDWCIEIAQPLNHGATITIL